MIRRLRLESNPATLHSSKTATVESRKTAEFRYGTKWSYPQDVR